MTKKDYELIARALKAARVSNTLDDPNKALYNNGIDNAVALMARVLAQDNPRFNRERFLIACGVQP